MVQHARSQTVIRGCSMLAPCWRFQELGMECKAQALYEKQRVLKWKPSLCQFVQTLSTRTKDTRKARGWREVVALQTFSRQVADVDETCLFPHLGSQNRLQTGHIHQVAGHVSVISHLSFLPVDAPLNKKLKSTKLNLVAEYGTIEHDLLPKKQTFKIYTPLF